MRNTHYRIGVITNVFGQSMADLTKTAKANGVTFEQIKFPFIPISGFHDSDLVTHICSYDVVYYRTGMQGPVVAELAQLLHNRGVPLVNGGGTHAYSHQKIRQSLIAGRYGIPQPKSVYVKQYNYNEVAKHLGPAFVVKPDEGSKGTEVTLIKNKEELMAFQKSKQKERHFYQEFIDDAAEYRVYTLGGRGIASYKKTRGGEDIRANLHAGGGMTETEAEYVPELHAFGGWVARCFGADFSGVDILKRGDRFYFLELNWQPGWEQLDELSGVNFCKATLQYLLDRAHAARPWWRRIF